MSGRSLHRLLPAAPCLVSLFLPLGRPLGARFSVPPVVADTVRPARAEEAPTVDGRLDETAWGAARPVPLPWEVQPGENAPAPTATSCRFLYDDEALYMGCRARDPRPEDVRARYGDRDGAQRDDRIVLWLDTFRDRRRAYRFSVNPLGVQGDALAGNDFVDTSWDGIWASGGRLTPSGYVVEIAVPFRALQYPTDDLPGAWGVVLERIRPRSVVRLLRSVPADYRDPCFLCRAQDLLAPWGTPPGHQIEVNPTVVASGIQQREGLEAPRFSRRDLDAEAGATARWRPAPWLAVHGTVNPDFSQVEADAAQLDANRRFALFFEEKRPFFVDNEDIFETPGEPLVFTRTVADPAAGMRVTGKAGSGTFGVLVARDRVTSILVPGREDSDRAVLDAGHTTLVTRYRGDVSESSTLGAVATVRTGAGYANRVAAGDAVVRPGGGFEIRGVAAVSSSTYADGVAEELRASDRSPIGWWAGGSGRFRSRSWDVVGQLEARTDGFRADAGFVPEVGFRSASLEANRFVRARVPGWFTTLGIGFDVDHSEFADGTLRGRSAQLLLDYEGPAQLEVDLDLTWRDEVLGGRHFATNEQELEVAVRPSGGIGATVELAVGRDVDVANGRPASKVELSPAVSWEPGRHLRLDASWAFQRLVAGGRAVLEESAFNVSAHYRFDRRLRVRLTGRLASERRRDPGERRRDPDAPPPAELEDDAAVSQLLLSYEVNPRTVAYLGYSDAWSGDRDVPLRQVSRTLFLKVGYALSF